jgi:hypothetical protein
MVAFFDGSTQIGTGPLTSGTASFTTSFPSFGTHSITAHYPGDSNFNATVSPAATVTITQATTTTTLTANASRSNVGQPVNFSVTVAPSTSTITTTPTGEVQILSGTTVIGTGTLSAGKVTISAGIPTAGTASVTAKYLGDANFSGSTSTALTQTVVASSTATVVTATPATVAQGKPVVLAATVSVNTPGAGTPTGTVQFFANGSLVGSAPLSGGKATLTTTTLPVGMIKITANYLGDANFTASNSSATAANPAMVNVGSAAEIYLNQVYLDVLNRPIDAPALAKWSAQLAKGVSRQSVVNQIVHSPEARTVAVQRVFRAYLGRLATPAEVSKTLASARHFGNDARVPVLTSAEFILFRGNGTTGGYITALGQLVLGLQTSSAAYASLTMQVNNGVQPVQIVSQMLASSGAHHAFVQSTFQSLFGRAATPAEASFYVGLLDGGQSSRQVYADILASQTYYNHVTSGL